MTTAGEGTGSPDFIGVGTQRSGTTWWFMSLLEHPGIRAPRSGNKETHFLTRFARGPMTDADVEHYYHQFPRRPGELAGEWTPRYMHDFWIPRLLRRVAPEAKLVIMFRDPIERFRSGVPKERTTRQRPTKRWAVADAIERGRYATQLSRLKLEHPEAELLVLQYEKCVADPASQYRRTLEFLGADTTHPPPDFQRRRGTSRASQKADLWPDLTEALRASLTDDVRALAAEEPEIDLKLWPNFADLACGASP